MIAYHDQLSMDGRRIVSAYHISVSYQRYFDMQIRYHDHDPLGRYLVDRPSKKWYVMRIQSVWTRYLYSISIWQCNMVRFIQSCCIVSSGRFMSLLITMEWLQEKVIELIDLYKENSILWIRIILSD